MAGGRDYTSRMVSRSLIERYAVWAFVAAGFSLAANAYGQTQMSATQRTRRTPIVDVFEQTKDAVVNIAATQIVERTVQFSPFDELFNPRLGPQRKQRYEQTSLGSGAVIHAEGYVITNAHVVAQAAEMKVIFANKTEHQAVAVAVDEQHDLAVLKIKDKGPFPAMILGRSNDLMIGETVVAIGNPLGYEHTVTTGIVSALHRKLPVGEDAVYDDLIQTDASINRGNSGGPLLNILGELIGLNTAIRSDAQNIGFAIPVDTIRKLLPDILSLEQRKRLQIGLRLGWRDKVYVAEVTGPAEKAGVEAGDEVLKVDGVTIRQDLDYYVHVLNIEAKHNLSLELKRGEKRFTVTFQPRVIPAPKGADLVRKKFGLVVEPLTAEQAQKLDVQGGLIITSVDAGSPAAEAGFVPGLIVVQIGRYFPADLDGLGLMLEKVRAGEKVRVRVYEIHRQYIQVMEGELESR